MCELISESEVSAGVSTKCESNMIVCASMALVVTVCM